MVDVPTSGQHMDPNDVLAQCLMDAGLSVARAGDADGTSSGVDLSGYDRSDPNVAAIVDVCLGRADVAASLDVGGDFAAGESDAGFDAYMETFLECMRREGFHPSIDEAAADSFEGGGALVIYAEGEPERQTFSESRIACEASARGSWAATVGGGE